MEASLLISVFAAGLAAGVLSSVAEAGEDFSPKPQEQQLPNAMHSAMKELPSITVARKAHKHRPSEFVLKSTSARSFSTAIQ